MGGGWREWGVAGGAGSWWEVLGGDWWEVVGRWWVVGGRGRWEVVGGDGR